MKNSKIQKSKYTMASNTVFMLKNAWKVKKSVIFLSVLLAILAAAKTTAEMLIAPMILKRVEEFAPLPELLLTILIFCGALLFLSCMWAFFNEKVAPGRVTVRMEIINQYLWKNARTSYPNLLDNKFLKMREKSQRAYSSNGDAAEAVWITLTDILMNILGFVVYLMLLSSLNPLLMLLVIVTTVAGYFVNKKINQWGYNHREEEAEYSKRIGYVSYTASQRNLAKDIRIFGLRDWIDDVWNSGYQLYRAFIGRRERVYIWSNIVNVVLTFFRNGIAYLYLIYLTLEQGLPASQFLLYFNTVSGFANWVTGILDKFSTLHMQSLDLSVVREVLDWPEEFQFEEGESIDTQKVTECGICLENVSFRYPEAQKDTISHMNLCIHPGEKLAIVGLNGAGKTTLVKLICGFLDPSEGRVLFNGEDIRKFNRRDYYKLFSAVFQDFSVLDVNVAENVAQNRENVDEKRVWECLEKAGLTEKVKSLPQELKTHIGKQVYEDGIELSGGQTQRLMLARALYKDAPMIVLDEPTAALDPIAENDIYMKYSEMTKGKTSLFISHRLASTRFCDRILFLEHGRIAEEGSHEELLRLGGGYAHLFEVQSQYYKEGGHRDEQHQDEK